MHAKLALVFMFIASNLLCADQQPGTVTPGTPSVFNHYWGIRSAGRDTAPPSAAQKELASLIPIAGPTTKQFINSLAGEDKLAAQAVALLLLVNNPKDLEILNEELKRKECKDLSKVICIRLKQTVGYLVDGKWDETAAPSKLFQDTFTQTVKDEQSFQKKTNEEIQARLDSSGLQKPVGKNVELEELRNRREKLLQTTGLKSK